MEDYKCELNSGGSVMFNFPPPFKEICSMSIFKFVALLF